MNDQTNMAQLRYLEELKISLVHAGFEPERIEDQHLPVCWEKGRLCRITGKGSVFYRRADVDTPQAEDALYRVEDIAAKTLEYMTAMETAPRLKVGGLTGDYRILADFGDAVLAGHSSERDASGIGFRLRAGRGPVHRKGKGDQDHHGADQVPIAGISGTDADNGTEYVSGVDQSTPLFL